MTHPADVVEPPSCPFCNGYVTDHEPTCRTLLEAPEVPPDWDDYR